MFVCLARTLTAHLPSATTDCKFGSGQVVARPAAFRPRRGINGTRAKEISATLHDGCVAKTAAADYTKH